MSDWQPIATAPTDGREALCLSPTTFVGPVMLRWEAARSAWVDWDGDRHHPTRWLPVPEDDGAADLMSAARSDVGSLPAVGHMVVPIEPTAAMISVGSWCCSRFEEADKAVVPTPRAASEQPASLARRSNAARECWLVMLRAWQREVMERDRGDDGES